MYSLKIQFFGGRGAKSGLGIKRMLSDFENNGVKKKKAEEIDASEYDSLEKWEKAILPRSYETLVAIDKNGTPVKAYKGNRNSVTFPVHEALKWKGYIVTHNHPSSHGGTFSFADMNNMCKFQYHQHRAVAAEGTYIIKSTKKSDYDKLRRMVETNMKLLKSKMQDVAKKECLKYYNTPVEERISKESYNVMVRQKYCGVLHRFYKKACEKSGFVYIMKPKSKYEV